jgi:hypothetical protein
MKTNLRMAAPVTVALLVAGCFMFPAATKAAVSGTSADTTELLADAKAEAVELKNDSADMESFVRSKSSWQSYANKIEMIKGHVNKTGELLAKLQEAETTGAPWQQEAIKRIEPALKELAANTEATIQHLNGNQTKVHFAAFRDYVKANYELATDLEAMIRDFVNYGEAKEKFERLGEKLEVAN